jgi:TRAP transporter TAXI family solute receptor
MIEYIQIIIFTIILGTFIYYQKDNIIDKFSNLNLNLNKEGFQMVSNLFSLEKPKILSQEIDITTEGVPTIAQDTESIFNNEVALYLANFVSLIPVADPNNIINNLIDVNNKKIDMMIVQEEMFHNAYTGRSNFKKPLKNLRFVAGLYYETFVLLTHPESGINSWKDIKGSIIGFPSKNSGSYMNGIKIAHAYGFEAGNDFRYINVDSMNRLANLFFQRKVDAIYLTTSNKNPYLKNLAKKMSLKFIGTNDIDENIMKTYFPCDSMKYINTNNFYTNINTASFIKTYATRSVLVVNKDIDEDYVYMMVKTIFQRSEELRIIANNYLYNSDKLNIVHDGFMPSLMAYVYEKMDYHMGAQKYYNEMYHTFEQNAPEPIKDIPEENETNAHPHFYPIK